MIRWYKTSSEREATRINEMDRVKRLDDMVTKAYRRSASVPGTAAVTRKCNDEEGALTPASPN